MMKQSTIGILGCGWLGKALAQRLISKEYQVKGSTTSEQKRSQLATLGIEPYLIYLPNVPKESESAFWNVDVLVVAFPPGLRNGSTQDYLEKIKCIENRLEKVKKVILINSTSIYKSDGLTKKEVDYDPSSILYKAESQLAQYCDKNGITFIAARCGGLMGYDRFPCKYFSSEKPIEGAGSKVNYIHRDDVVELLIALIEKQKVSDSFNLVCDAHPTREEVLVDCFEKLKETKPSFTEIKKDFKIVDNSKVKDVLQYSFKYSNPTEFKYTF